MTERAASSHPLGRLVRQRRLALGMTQAEAADHAHVSVGSWRNLESGRRRPRPATFAAITASLGLTADDVHQLHAIEARQGVDRARQELVAHCRDDLPDIHVDLVLRIVQLACRDEVAAPHLPDHRS